MERKAGACLYKEGSGELEQWVESKKDALYDGHASDIVKELDKFLKLLAKRDPGRKNLRERLEKIRNYLSKRLKKLNYKSPQEQDLEISSGSVEGTVNYVIAKRLG